MFGRLDAHVLNRIGRDLGTDDGLDQIEHAVVPEDVEDCRTEPHGRVVRGSATGQAAVEIAGEVAPRLLVDANQAVAEVQFVVGGGDFARLVKVVGQAVEHAFVLGNQGIDRFRRVQHASDQEVAITLEAA